MELQEIPNAKKILQGWNVTVASLTPVHQDLTDRLQKDGVQIVDFSSMDGKDILQSIHDRKMALPFSLALVSENKICARHTGLLGSEILEKWKERCSP